MLVGRVHRKVIERVGDVRKGRRGPKVEHCRPQWVVATTIAGGVVGGIMGLALLGILLFLLLRRRNRNTPSPLSSAYDPMMASQNAVSPGASTYNPFPASAGGIQEPYPVTYANQIPTNYIGTSATSGGQVGSNYSGMPQL